MFRPVRIILLLAAIAVATVLAVLGFIIVRNLPSKAPAVAVLDESATPAGSTAKSARPKRVARPARLRIVAVAPTEDDAGGTDTAVADNSNGAAQGVTFSSDPAKFMVEMRKLVHEAWVKRLKLRDDQLGLLQPAEDRAIPFFEKLFSFDGTIEQARKKARLAAQSQGITDPDALNQVEQAAEGPVRSDFPAAFERVANDVVAALEKLRPGLDAEQAGELDELIRDDVGEDAKKQIKGRVANGLSPIDMQGLRLGVNP
jgi:hypothetical protein